MTEKHIALLTATAALCLTAALASVAVTAPDGPALWVDKLVLRTPAPRAGSAPDHRVTLRGELELGPPADYDLRSQDVVLTVGGIEVLALRGAEREGLREVRPLRWRYRGPRDAGRPRLLLDFATGTFRLKARALDLSALGDDAAIQLALRVDTTTWCGHADVERTARRIKLIRPPPAEQLPRAGVDDGPHYSPSAITENTVVRSDEEWAAMWARLDGEGEPPAVDFATEMVVAVVVADKGASLERSVRIDRVVARGDDVVVKYTETFDTSHPVFALAVTPKALVSVPLRTGRVRFDRRFRRIR